MEQSNAASGVAAGRSTHSAPEADSTACRLPTQAAASRSANCTAASNMLQSELPWSKMNEPCNLSWRLASNISEWDQQAVLKLPGKIRDKDLCACVGELL